MNEVHASLRRLGLEHIDLYQIHGVDQVTPMDETLRAMDDLVADLHKSVAGASNGPVTMVGESFGGALALSYALAHPERIGRLVILNSFAHFGSPPASVEPISVSSNRKATQLPPCSALSASGTAGKTTRSGW